MFTFDMTGHQRVHEEVVSHAKRRAAMDHETCVLLLLAESLRVHEHLGYGSFREYVVSIFGLSQREARERLRVARALEGLPKIEALFASGELCWSKVRELTRVAEGQTEAEWLASTARCNATEVERKVAGYRRGQRPTEKPSEQRPRKIMLEVSADTLALFEEAKTKLRAELGGQLSEDALVAAMARALLGAGASGEAREPGLSSYQIALVVCERCKVATQRAGGAEVVVGEATLARAECDATQLGRVDAVEGTAPRAPQSIPPRTRRNVVARHHGRCAVPGCSHASFVDVHHVERRADGGGHDPNLLITLCGAHHKAVHEGVLVIGGSFEAGFSFWHADGSGYGAKAASPARSATLATVLTLLVGMGFKQRESQAMVDRIRPSVDAETSVEQALAAALREGPSPTCSRVREDYAVYQPVRYVAA